MVNEPAQARDHLSTDCGRCGRSRRNARSRASGARAAIDAVDLAVDERLPGFRRFWIYWL
jgi:hypothetical protein